MYIGNGDIMKTAKVKIYILIVCLYVLISFIAFWPIILGTDIMRWDIWCAHYPLQVMVSDAIKTSGAYPLWNPLIRFGVPYYAFVGTPVWYPITLLLNIIGYSPFMPGVEYSLHCAIASFGMFLLANEVLNGKDSARLKETDCSQNLLGPVISGLFYGFSGVFLSNAEHIMIIISAAWIPYVLCFSRKFVSSESLLSCMTAGIFAGFILTGGYPELFYNLFIVMCLMNIYWNNEKNPQKGYLIAVKNGMISTFKIGIATLLASAITIIPFLKIMSEITRSGGQSPFTYSTSTLLSTLFPVTFDKLSGYDLSMGLFYIGFLPILLLPVIIKFQKKDYLFYGVMSFFSLLLCFGSNSFIHTLFYRFLPTYSTFRFPTLWRVFFSLFTLLLISRLLSDILESVSTESVSFFEKSIKAFLVVLSVMSLTCYLATVLSDKTNKANLTEINGSVLLLLIFAVLYVSVFILLERRKISARVFSLLLVCVVASEVLQVSYKAFPVMIAAWDQEAYFRDQNVKREIDRINTAFSNRVNTENFAGHLRASSGLLTENIAKNKFYDEEGYVSVLLKNTVRYSWSHNRTITQNLPEIYFTNDIIGSDRISLDEWLNKSGSAPYQIHADGIKLKLNENSIRQYEVNSAVGENLLEHRVSDNSYEISGNFTSSHDNRITKFRVYPKSFNDNVLNLTCVFTDTEGNQSSYTDNYIVYKNQEGESFSEISLPVSIASITGNAQRRYYSNIGIQSSVALKKITEVEYIQGLQDRYAVITNAGYNSMTITVNAPTDGIVNVLQNNYDGWQLYVDGKKTPIVEVNGVFIGVPVSKGTHTIELKFRPVDFYVGAGITLIYFWVYIFMLVFRYVRRNQWGIFRV